MKNNGDYPVFGVKGRKIEFSTIIFQFPSVVSLVLDQPQDRYIIGPRPIQIKIK